MADRLPGDWQKTFLGWPGLGDNPPDPAVNSYEDLIALTAAHFGDAPVDLLAQSMGGAIALTLALRYSDRIRSLTLAVTAGGLDVEALGASDWRPDYIAEFPHVAPWVMAERPNVAEHLGDVRQPTLLIWGDADPISPVAVGRELEMRLPDARLMVVPGGHHDLINRRPDDVAPAILEHLTRV